jgi:hypothetical protein
MSNAWGNAASSDAASSDSESSSTGSDAASSESSASTRDADRRCVGDTTTSSCVLDTTASNAVSLDVFQLALGFSTDGESVPTRTPSAPTHASTTASSVISGGSSGRERSRSPRQSVAGKVGEARSYAKPGADLNADTSPNLFRARPVAPTTVPVAVRGLSWWLVSMFNIIGKITAWEIPDRPMVHETCCSGSMGELLPQMYLPLWIRTLSGSDKKPSCQVFSASNFKPYCDHLFETMSDQAARSGKCAMHHNQVCYIQDDSDLDALTGGTPCQAWTSAREKTGDKSRTGSIASHPEWDTTFNEYFALVDSRNPKGGWLEQVPGFFHKPAFSRDTEMLLRGYRSPGDLFIAQLEGRGYSVAYVTQHAAIWGEPTRERHRMLLQHIYTPYIVSFKD